MLLTIKKINSGLIIMKKTTLYTAIITGILSSGVAYSAPTFKADFELNTDAVDKEIGDTTFDQNGRLALNTFGKHTSGDNYIEGKGTLLITTDGKAEIDDAYVKIGNQSMDVQLGRFEAVNLFPKAKDTMIEHAGGVSVYEANKVRGRAGDDGGQIAFHFAASDNLNFEVGTIFGDDDALGDNTEAVSGIRPVAVLTTDMATFTAGFESVKYDLTAGGDVSQTGYALAVNFDVSAANINLAATHMKDDNSKQEVNSYVANMTYGNFGLGLISSDVDNTAGADPSVITTYVAYSMPIFDIENATVTLAGSYSKADDVAAGVNDKTLATRVRINYDF